MAIATLVCSIISALIAVINVTITVWSSILDIDINHSISTNGNNKFLRIEITNNGDISTKIKSLVVESSTGVLRTSSDTSMFVPFAHPEILIGHQSVRYGYLATNNEIIKKISIVFSKRTSLISHKKVIFLD